MEVHRNDSGHNPIESPRQKAKHKGCKVSSLAHDALQATSSSFSQSTHSKHKLTASHPSADSLSSSSEAQGKSKWTKDKHKTTNGKVQSAYHQVTFSVIDGKSYMEVCKAKDGTERKITYKRKKEIGSGTSGRVYLFVHQPAEGEELKKPKAVKVAYSGDPSHHELMRSLDILEEQYSHPDFPDLEVFHIPGLISKVKFILVADNKIQAIQSLYEKGDITKSLGKLSPEEMINATAQLLFGLNHLHRASDHKAGRIHRDIKPENIFQRENSAGRIEYALADLDDAHLVDDISPSYSYTQGYFSRRDEQIAQNEVSLWAQMKAKYAGKKPQKYRSFSEEEKKRFNQAHDIFAMGLSLREFFTGRVPWQALRLASQLLTPLTLDDLPIQKAKLSDEQIDQLKGICHLINQMTASNWRKRITAADALKTLEELGIALPEYGITQRTRKEKL
jgi:serine/threonine protein kinase